MKTLKSLPLAAFFAAMFATLLALTACGDKLDDENEYVDWKARNSKAFVQKMNEAKKAVADAKAAYGDDWAAHCKWRLFRNYVLADTKAATLTDSICVEILEEGRGSGCPLYTDSVRVNYIGRLISTDLTQPLGTLGKAFDHSGISDRPEDVFNPDFAVPTTLRVSNTIEGFTTALQQMHIGDLWRVYIPQQMGYGSASTESLPAYSTLIFDIQLKSYYRAGVFPGTWQ